MRTSPARCQRVGVRGALATNSVRSAADILSARSRTGAMSPIENTRDSDRRMLRCSELKYRAALRGGTCPDLSDTSCSSRGRCTERLKDGARCT